MKKNIDMSNVKISMKFRLKQKLKNIYVTKLW
jgi:hypothetical protein